MNSPPCAPISKHCGSSASAANTRQISTPHQPRDEWGRWTDGDRDDSLEDIPDESDVELTAFRSRFGFLRGLFAPRKSEDILMPNGRLIGQQYRGAGAEIRTVTRSEFDALYKQLHEGARPVSGPTGYRGQVFERRDGIQFGLRISHDSGQTIEVIGGNTKNIPRGFKVHFR